MKKIPLTYLEHVEVGQRLKALEQECRDVTELLNQRQQPRFATAFRKRWQKIFHPTRSSLEELMLATCPEAKTDPWWGSVYFGQDYHETTQRWGSIAPLSPSTTPASHTQAPITSHPEQKEPTD